MIYVTIPIKIESESNKREHWSRGYRRKKKQQDAVRLVLKNQIKQMDLPVIVTLTRIAPRKLDAEDNLPISFKGIRDVIADMLIPGKKMGQADSDPRITWRYEQENGGVKVYAFRIEIELSDDTTCHE